jgi:hypothetical protein
MRLAGYIDRGLTSVHEEQAALRPYVDDVRAIWATLDSESGSGEQRQAQFGVLQAQFQHSADPTRQHMGRLMSSFAPGLFVGGDAADMPQDNLDLERWFKHPKGHERRIHGHQHAGVRIVQEGPTLLLALDAHLAHSEPFTGEELWPYRASQIPAGQRQALHRRKMMRRARSKKQRPLLLAELEHRYLDDS